MVVKEPQEASEIVKSYPEINWEIVGLPPLRIALYTCVAVTALGGILSNPLFKLAIQQFQKLLSCKILLLQQIIFPKRIIQ